VLIEGVKSKINRGEVFLITVTQGFQKIDMENGYENGLCTIARPGSKEYERLLW
jgi:hypothetical protein